MTRIEDRGTTAHTLMTVDRALELHDVALAAWGGLPGPADPAACLDAAIGAAHTAETYLEGKKAAKAGLAFAGYALFYVVRRHCFSDGNKRVGWMIAVDVLASLGLGVTASEDDVVAMVEQVISHQIDSGEEVAAWLSTRLYAIS